MQNLKPRNYIFALALFSPVFAQAAQVSDLKSLVSYLISILNALIPLLLAVAVVGFIWGVIRYMYSVNSKNLAEARSYIIFSVIALTVMLSVWGLAFLVKNSFFPDSKEPFHQGTPIQTNSLNGTSGTTAGGNANIFPTNGYDAYGRPVYTISTDGSSTAQPPWYDRIIIFFTGH